MIGAWTGHLAHRLVRLEAWRGGVREGELVGIPPRGMRALLRRARLERVREVPFRFG